METERHQRLAFAGGGGIMKTQRGEGCAVSLFKRKEKKMAYDPAAQQPAVRCSICTGEMTAGYIDRATGKFHEVMRVDGRAGLEAFCAEIGARPEDVKTIY